MHVNGLKLSGALEEYSITTPFWAQKCKIKFLKKIRVLSAVFSKLKYRLFKTRLADLQKHKHPECLLMNDFS